MNNVPANTHRNKHVIITSKRRFDVMITCLLRFVFTGVRVPRIVQKLVASDVVERVKEQFWVYVHL